MLIVISLPILGTWMRRQSSSGCALDGLSIDPVYEVRISAADGDEQRFCCLQCAEWWSRRRGKTPTRVLVTDEATGHRIDAHSAFFVRSGVITNASTGNRVHAFQSQADAQRHATECRGTLLSGSSRPFETVRHDETAN